MLAGMTLLWLVPNVEDGALLLLAFSVDCGGVFARGALFWLALTVEKDKDKDGWSCPVLEFEEAVLVGL